MNAAELAIRAAAAREKRSDVRVSICCGSPCLAAGGAAILTGLAGLDLPVTVQTFGTGCMGPCSRGPLMRIESPGKISTYERMTAALAASAVMAHLKSETADGLLSEDLPFFVGQQRIVLSNCGSIDPEDMESALAAGAYQALSRVLTEMTPEQVCSAITASGLRGRGGGGYPTGTKWNLVREAVGTQKYVVANGDEGDPGAFMDRTLMESDPHRLLEGMAIAGYAVGARHGFIYVRGEYPLAARRLRLALQQAEKNGILGRRVLGSNFSFNIRLRIGAGAFVCGEETALMASVMGRRGQPLVRPPYPATRGLWGCSTLINNVETFGCVPPIINEGAAWFSSIGTPGNSGTKVFSISGDIATIGVMEVPLGTPLRRIVEMAGGVAGGGFKAAQTGGASGGCIPADHLDLPVDFDSLPRLGSIMGSGGMIIINDRRCMPDVARFFIDFCREESCGKCVPCRTGTEQLLRLLDRITQGVAQETDLDHIEELCHLMRDASLCGLGMAAPTPVLSTLRWFRDEYEAHIRTGRCPSGVCRNGEP